MTRQAQIFKFIRKAEMPAYKLAFAAGIPTSTLYRWLHQQGDLSLTQWDRLLKAIERKERGRAV